jgi:hypothetical protein
MDRDGKYEDKMSPRCLQLTLALNEVGRNISEFDLKSWYGYKIANEETKEVAQRCIFSIFRGRIADELLSSRFCPGFSNG